MREGPHEWSLESGGTALSPTELITKLVHTELTGVNALDICGQLVRKFGPLGATARASRQNLRSIRGVGHDKAVRLAAAFAPASKLADELMRESPLLDIREAVANLLREQNWLKEVETFRIVLLNTRHRLIRVQQVLYREYLRSYLKVAAGEFLEKNSLTTPSR